MQINLLPWREEERTRKKLQMAIMAIASAISGIIFVLLMHFSVAHVLSVKKNRIVFLQTRLSQEQGYYNQLKDQQKKQNKLLDQIREITQLRERSYLAVALFNELPKLVPQTVTIEKLARAGNIIAIQGRVDNEVNITVFMKNLSNSSYFTKPILTKMSIPEGAADENRSFQIQIEQKEEL